MGARNGKAVVLLSGGQDSTTALFVACDKFAEVHALTVYYGQRHASELKAAMEIASLAGVPHTQLPLPLDQVGGSVLTERDRRPIGDERGFADDVAGLLPATYVPGRNAMMLVLATSFAAVRGANTVVIGASQLDYSGYPDCREGFFAAIGPALEVMLPSSCRPMTIERPFVHATKEAEVMTARSLGPRAWTALARSVTCYNGLRGGCEACPACALRAAGFAKAKLEDPAKDRRKRALADAACTVLRLRDELPQMLTVRDLTLDGGFTLERMPDAGDRPYGLIGPGGNMLGPLNVDGVVDALCSEVMDAPSPRGVAGAAPGGLP